MILIVVEKIAPPVRDVRLSSRDCSHARQPRFSDRVAVANKGKAQRTKSATISGGTKRGVQNSSSSKWSKPNWVRQSAPLETEEATERWLS